MALAVFMIGSATAFAWGPGGNSETGEGRGGHRGHGLFAVVAEQLGLTKAELKAELKSGKTINEVAIELGVDSQTIVDAVVANRTEKLDQAVEGGRITQEQADERLAQIETRITERLAQTLPLGDGHGRRGHRGPGHTEA